MNWVYYRILQEENHVENKHINLNEEETEESAEQTDTFSITIPKFNEENYINLNNMSSLSIDSLTTIDMADYMVSDTITISGTAAQTTTLTGSALSGNIGTNTTSINLDDYTNVTMGKHKELIERVEKLEAALIEEAELRAKHPALKTAYDEYRLLLALAKQHTPDILTDE